MHLEWTTICSLVWGLTSWLFVDNYVELTAKGNYVYVDRPVVPNCFISSLHKAALSFTSRTLKEAALTKCGTQPPLYPRLHLAPCNFISPLQHLTTQSLFSHPPTSISWALLEASPIMSYLADKLKEQGNATFRDGDFVKAEELYTQAIQKYSQNPLIFTNRANARLKLQM